VAVSEALDNSLFLFLIFMVLLFFTLFYSINYIKYTNEYIQDQIYENMFFFPFTTLTLGTYTISIKYSVNIYTLIAFVLTTTPHKTCTFVDTKIPYDTYFLMTGYQTLTVSGTSISIGIGYVINDNFTLITNILVG